MLKLLQEMVGNPKVRSSTELLTWIFKVIFSKLFMKIMKESFQHRVVWYIGLMLLWCLIYFMVSICCFHFEVRISPVFCSGFQAPLQLQYLVKNDSSLRMS